MSKANASVTDFLCTQCGLCCDGSLFADVELASSKEADALEAMGLEIEEEDDRNVLLQPCRALQGKRCSIYSHRPKCCRTFECQLLQKVKLGLLKMDDAQETVTVTFERIGHVKKLLAQLGQREPTLSLKERYDEAMVVAENSAPNPQLKAKRAELKKVMTAAEVLIRKNFLGL